MKKYNANKIRLITGLVCVLLIMSSITTVSAIFFKTGGTHGIESDDFDDHVQHKQWIALRSSVEGAPPEVTVLESNNDKTIIAIDFFGFWCAETSVEEQEFHHLSIPDHTTKMEVGKPAVPVIHTTVAIPFDSIVDLEILDSTEVMLTNYYVYPFQQPTRDQSEETHDFVIDEEFYQTDTLYPISQVDVSSSGIWRDLNIVVLEIAPVRFSPSTGELTVNTHLIIELSYSSTDQGFVRSSTSSIASQYIDMYKGQVINFDWLDIPKGGLDRSDGPTYLIITHPGFESAIQPLAEWHHKEGLETEVLTISTTSAFTIKNEITARYDLGNLEYVLLVGDPLYIPVYYWSGYLSDYWYACITGAPDVYADITVGRLSVTSTSQVDNQVAKILTYEKNPPLDSWLNKILLVAHLEDAPGKYVECKNYIKNYIISPPFIVDTAYGHMGGVSNALVASKINEGRNVVNYRGHGSETAWTTWNYLGESWYTTNVHSLSNGDRTPIVFNIACDNHMIQYSGECLGEAWMNEYPGGAVASLGATDPSWTYPNHDYDKDLFRQFCEYGQYRIGWMSNAAATHIIGMHGSLGQDNAKMYLWLGDAATEVWTDIPSTLDVTHATTIPVEGEPFLVHVEADGSPLEDAYVCLWKDDEVYETGYTNPSGDITFNPAPVTLGDMYVTVTMHDYLPYEGITEVVENAVILEGYCYYPDMRPVEDVTVDVINMNTGDAWGAVTVSNYYSLELLPGDEINVGDMLRLIAMDDTNCINVTHHLVTTMEILTKNIVIDLILDIHYRNLEKFPGYATGQPIDLTVNQLCGAAVGKMFLDYCHWNSSVQPAPSWVFGQPWIFNNFTSFDLPQEYIDVGLNWYEDPEYIDTWEMWQGLAWNSYEFGYNYWGHTNSSSDIILKTICVMMDYPIPTAEGHPEHIGAAFPAYGDYSNWMAIRGIHTDKDTWDPPSFPDFTVHGFWVNDPHPQGIGKNSYKTTNELLTTYMLPMDLPGEPFEEGKYTVVVEPPEDFDLSMLAQTEMDIGEQPGGYTSLQRQMLRYSRGRGHTADTLTYQTARKSIQDICILEGINLDKITPRSITYVNNHVSSDYQLVIFDNIETEETLVVSLDAATGRLKEFSIGDLEPGYLKSVSYATWDGTGSPFHPTNLQRLTEGIP